MSNDPGGWDDSYLIFLIPVGIMVIGLFLFACFGNFT